MSDDLGASDLVAKLVDLLDVEGAEQASVTYRLPADGVRLTVTLNADGGLTITREAEGESPTTMRMRP